MEIILAKDNLNQAYLQVYRNKGSQGIDGMKVEELRDYLMLNKDLLLQELLQERYKPKPVLMVEIPKDDGSMRMLGIPVVVDRVIQQAISQVLIGIFDQTFSESSYGFRPKRSAQDAIKQANIYINEGHQYVVDIDLSKYFDTVNHDKLMYLLTKGIKDSRVLRLIRTYLKGGIVKNGVLEATTIGVPQGSPLSPILSNIYLHEIDKELEKRGHKFCRYADDMQIYVKSKRAGERVMKSITKVLETKMKLKVNEAKSAVRDCTKSKFLGFTFYRYTKENIMITPHPKSREKFKARVRVLLKRNQGRNIHYVIFKLNEFLTGWINYFSAAKMATFIVNMSSWIRRKIRVYIWKQWKKVKTRFTSLMKLGISRSKSWQWANTRKGLWRISKSPILHLTLTDKYISKLGFKNLVMIYSKAHIKFL